MILWSLLEFDVSWVVFSHFVPILGHSGLEFYKIDSIWKNIDYLASKDTDNYHLNFSSSIFFAVLRDNMIPITGQILVKTGIVMWCIYCLVFENAGYNFMTILKIRMLCCYFHIILAI